MANGAPTVSNGLVISGVTTVTTLDLNGDLDVDGHLNADNVSIAGVCTATTFYGSGANLTGIDATKIITGNTQVQTIDTGSDGHIKFTTEGSERLRITSTGNLSIASSDITKTWSLGKALHIGNAENCIWGESGDGVHMVQNAYYNSGYKKVSNDRSSLYTQYQGIHAWSTAAAASADSAVSFTESLRIDSSGRLLKSGQAALTSTALSHPMQVAADSSAQNIVLFGRASDDISAIDFYEADKSTRLGEIQYRTNQLNIRHRSAGADIIFATTPSGGSLGEKVRITSDGHTLFSGLTTKNDPRNANGITLKSAAGVSFQNFGSNGSRNWRIRPDDQSRWGDLDFSVSPTANSATDWPDAAADKVLTLGYDGTVLKPRNPLFVAQKSAAISGTGFVTFNTVVENVGSCYDSSNGRFTAPVAGYYWFCCKINAYRRIDFYFKRNGSNSGNTNREIGQFNTSNQDGWFSHNLVRIFELSANDYVQVDVTVIQQNSDPGEWITFQGYLLQ